MNETVECPKCGCNDVEPFKGRWRCNHCGSTFLAASSVSFEIIAVEYHVMRCPICGSEKTKVYSTVRPVRYHKCLYCGANFKSVEKIEKKS